MKWVKLLLLIPGFFITVGVSINLMPSTYGWVVGSFAFALFAYLLILHIHKEVGQKPLACRMCNKVKPMAITYETDGLCRSCLDEILEMQGLKEKADGT